VQISSRETGRQDVNCKHEFAAGIADIDRRLGKDASHGANGGNPGLARKPNLKEQVDKQQKQVEDLQKEKSA